MLTEMLNKSSDKITQANKIKMIKKEVHYIFKK